MTSFLRSVSFLLTVGAAGICQAQAFECPNIPRSSAADPCILQRAKDTATILLRLVNADGTPYSRASIDLNAMFGSIDTQLTTDTDGRIFAFWRGQPPMANAADTVVASLHANRAVNLRLIVRPLGGNAFGLVLTNPDTQSWYAGHQLKRPIVVQVVPVPVACSDVVVAFKPPTSGEANPDTVRASSTPGGACEASTRWRLGTTGGIQTLRIAVNGSSQPPLLVQAKARKEPWLLAGLAAAYDRGYTGVTRTDSSVTVKVTNGNTELTTVETGSKSSKSDVRAALGLAPIVGINTPVFTRWSNIRISASADMKHPTTDWYLGLSIPQWYDGLWHEDIGVDLQVVAHLSKHMVPKAGVACDNTTCASDTNTSFVGIGLAGQLNAALFLSALGALFPAK